jgi:hypothetical protein
MTYADSHVMASTIRISLGNQTKHDKDSNVNPPLIVLYRVALTYDTKSDSGRCHSKRSTQSVQPEFEDLLERRTP